MKTLTPWEIIQQQTNIINDSVQRMHDKEDLERESDLADMRAYSLKEEQA